MDPENDNHAFENSLFALQHHDSDRAETLKIILEEHYTDVYNQAYLFLSGDSARAKQAVRRTFSIALERKTKFKGQVSPKAWLYAICFWVCTMQGGAPQKINYRLPDEFPELSRNTLLILILYYRDQISIPDIAYILNQSIHSTRDNLLSTSQEIPGYPLYDESNSHEKTVTRVYAIKAGTISQTKHAELNEHVDQCKTCKNFISELQNWENNLRKILQADIPDPDFTPEEFESEFNLILSENLKSVKKNRQTGMFMVGWGTISIILILMLTWMASTLIDQNGFGQIPFFSNDRETYYRNSGILSIFEPSISDNGRWLSFVSPDITYQIGDTNQKDDIYLFDLDTNISTPISLYSNGLLSDGDSFNPVITEDGRWTVFASHSRNLEADEAAICESNIKEKSHCSNIYLYDREKSNIQFVSKPNTPEGSTGDSFAPTISPDGGWIAFWSSSRNLTPGDNETCNNIFIEYNCLDIFLYNTSSQTISRIPIGRELNKNPMNYRLDMSRNGRWMTIILLSEDRISSEIQVQNGSDVFIYDRKEAEFELGNLQGGNIKGNRASYTGSISNDGRYVIFTSSAQNLVDEPTPGDVNVYLRDRTTQITSLVSKENNTGGLNGNSGVANPRNIKSGEFATISPDGEWASYTTQSPTLMVTDIPWWCKIPSFGLFHCSNVVVQSLKSNIQYLATTPPAPNNIYTYLFIVSNPQSNFFVEKPTDCLDCVSLLWRHQSDTFSLELIEYR